MHQHRHNSTAARMALVLALLCCSLSLHAQKEQDADTLIWNTRKYAVLNDRYRPSVVQRYFLRRVAAPPFHAWSTNNNRGHIAYLEFIDDVICVDSIEAKRFRTPGGNLWAESGIDTVVSPAYFHMRSLSATDSSLDEHPIADWYSGLLQLRFIPQNKKEQKLDEARGERWLRVDKGQVTEIAFVTDKELQVLGEADANPAKLSAIDSTILRLWQLQQRLDAFYQLCAAEREPVTYKGHEGLFDHRDQSLSLLMEVYDNDPLAWDQENGATTRIANPMRRWRIVDNKVLLDDERNTWADWLEGEYTIHYGNWEQDALGVSDYRVYKTQRIRIAGGLIVSSQFSPRSFDDDSVALSAAAFSVCNPQNVFSVDDKQLMETVGKLKSPKKSPAYEGDKGALRAWLQSKQLTDERARQRLFRVRIGFLVNCNGQAGSWQILNRGKGELNEFAEMVLEIIKEMPQRWQAAEDRKGNKLDCWQVLEFTVSGGSLTNVNYK